MLPQQLKKASSKKAENCKFSLPQSKSSITCCGSTLTGTSKHLHRAHFSLYLTYEKQPRLTLAFEPEIQSMALSAKFIALGHL